MLKKISKGVIIGGVSYYTIYKSLDYMPEYQIKYDLLGFMSCNLNFLRTAKVATECILDYSINIKNIEDEEIYDREKTLFYTRIGKKMYNLCSKNKGIFIKFAQYISNLERIIPHEITSILKELQDKCPAYKIEAVELVLREELGNNWRDFIKEIDDEPVGAASLAQVHKGINNKGETVAVKVQYPQLRVQYILDIGYLSFLSKVLSNFVTYANLGNYDFDYLLNKFKDSLKDEIDFRIEVKNSLKTQELFKNDESVKIPSIYENLSTKRIITMEFVEGVNIDENEKLKEMGFKLLDISNLLINMFSSMIFINGHVHCDAHAGNIFVRRNPKNPSKPQIILLDHGFYRGYSEEFRKNVNELWLALMNLDNKKMKFYAAKLGIKDHYNYLPLIFLFKTKNQNQIGKKIVKKDILKMRKDNVFGFEKVYKFIYEFPDDFLLTLRTINLIAIRNSSLGGRTRHRLFRMTKIAYRAKYKNIFIRNFHLFKFHVKIFLYEWMFFLYKMVYYIDPKII